jgi:hypothetical protein
MDDLEEGLTHEEDEAEQEMLFLPLVAWVTSKLDIWRDDRDEKFMARWKEYNRLWRGEWASEDKLRQSERSRFIAPAVAQAVDSAIAEIEEATFGRGKPFVLEGANGEMTPPEVVQMEQKFYDELQRNMARRATSECLINAAVFGTGIAEIVVEEVDDRIPMEQPDPNDPNSVQVGVGERKRIACFWKPIQPNNFLIDPNSSTINDALGVAIEEYVGRSIVERGIAQGLYRDVDIEPFNTDTDLEKDLNAGSTIDDDRVKLTRYYGLVPTKLLEGEDEEVDGEDSQEYTEVVLVMLNDDQILKVEENPYMMQDRPIVAFAWDLVPNRFWGRGVVEKGYNAQKALDTEIRARHDSLALTVHPMMAIDAARMPRGFKFEVSPGRSIFTNGNPAEILMPFKFGQTDGTSYQEASEMEKMVFQATGAVDLTGIPGQINGDSTAAGMSMSLSGAIKRFKRTLLNFQEQFLMPALEKSMWRYNEMDPENYPALPLTFKPSTTLGLIAREYETAQLVTLLAQTSPDDPARSVLLSGIIENSSLPNRAGLIEQMNPQPTPEQQQQQQMQQELAMRAAVADVAKKEAEARKADAEAYYWKEVKPQIDMVNAMAESRPDTEGNRGFTELVKIADLAIKEKDIDSNERIVRAQNESKAQADTLKQDGDATRAEMKAMMERVDALTKNVEKMTKAKRRAKREADGSVTVSLED